VDFSVPFKGKRSIKDMIESLGVPHAEIDLILVNGRSVDFTYIVKEGDRVSVYPVFESLNIQEPTRLRKMPLRRTRFIADVNLADIARLMRLLGFDVYFQPNLSERQIIDISLQEHRIILTRSKKLLKFKTVTHGVFVRRGDKERQIRDILDRLDIRDQARPFSRCLRCNAPLKRVAKDTVLHRVPARSRSFCDEFFVCQSCDRVYWNGTHVIRMRQVVARILA